MAPKAVQNPGACFRLLPEPASDFSSFKLCHSQLAVSRSFLLSLLLLLSLYTLSQEGSTSSSSQPYLSSPSWSLFDFPSCRFYY